MSGAFTHSFIILACPVALNKMRPCRYNSMLQVVSVGSIVLPMLLSQMDRSVPSSLKEVVVGGGECTLSTIEQVSLHTQLFHLSGTQHRCTSTIGPAPPPYIFPLPIKAHVHCGKQNLNISKALVAMVPPFHSPRMVRLRLVQLLVAMWAD
jgi:hypothetical protein